MVEMQARHRSFPTLNKLRTHNWKTPIAAERLLLLPLKSLSPSVDSTMEQFSSSSDPHRLSNSRGYMSPLAIHLSFLSSLLRSYLLIFNDINFSEIISVYLLLMLRIVHNARGTIAWQVLPDAVRPLSARTLRREAASHRYWILKSNHDSVSWSDTATILFWDIVAIY